MLPPFIIEQIRQREEQRKWEQPRLDLPLDDLRPRLPSEQRPGQEPEVERGVVIIDI